MGTTTQPKPDYLDQLLDLAKRETGSDYATAKQIGVSRHTLSDWRAGRKAVPPGDVGLLAHIAGLDADVWVCRQVIEHYAGTEKGTAIREVLKKALAATGAAIVSSGSASAETLSHFIRCIQSKVINLTG